MFSKVNRFLNKYIINTSKFRIKQNYISYSNIDTHNNLNEKPLKKEKIIFKNPFTSSFLKLEKENIKNKLECNDEIKYYKQNSNLKKNINWVHEW